MLLLLLALLATHTPRHCPSCVSELVSEHSGLITRRPRVTATTGREGAQLLQLLRPRTLSIHPWFPGACARIGLVVSLVHARATLSLSRNHA